MADIEAMQRLEPFVADLSEDELAPLDRASSLVPVLAADAAQSDADRTLSDETIVALEKNGLFRLGTPRALGGYQAGMIAAIAVAAEVGRGCSSAAWVLVVYYTAARAVWMFPDEVRRRVWGENPDATICGSSGTGAPARPVPEGFRISGRWGWASGVNHADWIILDVTDEDGGRGVALVPTADLRIEDTWQMAGMRGTGSNSVVADDVLVPADQVLFMSGASPMPSDLPRPQGVHGAMAGPILGMGMALYDHTVEKLTAGRPLVSATKLHDKAVDAPGIQANVADASLLIDTALLHAARSARVIDRATRTGRRLTPLEDARVRMDGGVAGRRIREAADRLLDVGGASQFAESSPVQRIWRDLGTALRHPAYVMEVDRERYAHLLLGLA